MNQPRQDTAFLTALAPVLEAQPHVVAAWIESRGAPRSVAVPGDVLDLHVGTSDDLFDRLKEEVGGAISGVEPLALEAWGAAPFEGARAAGSLASGRHVEVTLERMSLIGKRPRQAIQVILDKTGMMLTGLCYGQPLPE